MDIPDEDLSLFEGCGDSCAPGMVRVSFGIRSTEEKADEFLEIPDMALKATRARAEEFRLEPDDDAASPNLAC